MGIDRVGCLLTRWPLFVIEQNCPSASGIDVICRHEHGWNLLPAYNIRPDQKDIDMDGADPIYSVTANLRVIIKVNPVQFNLLSTD